MSYGLRLHCYDVDGASRGAARGMLVERYARAGEAGRLLVDFSELAPRSELFAAPVEVAVEYYVPDATPPWVEPEDGRYIIAQDSHERTADPTDPHDLTLLGIGQRLAGPKVLLPIDLDEYGKRKFLAQTPGQIIGTLVTEAQARGGIPGITLGFTDTHDSTGTPWPNVYNRAYELSHSILGILQNLHEGGAVDPWWEGRELHMVPSGTRGRDLSTGNDPVYLRDRTLASPERDDWTRLADSALLIGDDGQTWTRDNPAAYKPFGTQEVVIKAAGVTDEATAIMMMDAALAEGAAVARQVTREWQWTPAVRWMPDRDIRIGDWILADTSAGTRQRVRVADLMVRQGPDGIEAFVTLGSVADDLMTRLAKRQLGIEGGAGVGSIGTPAPPAPEAQNGPWPATPGGLIVSTATVILPNGDSLGQISGSWDAVTTDTDGKPVTVDHYVLRARHPVTGQFWPVYSGAATSGSGSYPDFTVGSQWYVSVAAVIVDGPETWTGPFSPEQAVTIEPDLIPPPVPSTPIVTSARGAARIEWDGLNQTGGGMPPDLHRLDVYQTGIVDPVDSIDPVTKVTSIFGLAIDSTVEFRLVAVDFSGNESDPSQPASVTVQSVLSGTEWAAQMAKVTSYGSNLYPDPAYHDEGRNTLRENVGFAISNGAITPTSATASYLWLTGDGTTGTPLSYEADRNYLVEATVVAYSGAASVKLMAWDGAAMTQVGATVSLVLNEQKRLELTYAPSSLSHQLVLEVTGQPTLWGVSVRMKSGGVLIEDESITATNLYADGAFANKIAAALGQFDVLEAGWIRAYDIDGDTFTGKLFKGLKVEAGEFQTSPLVNTGIKLNTGQDGRMRFYNAANELTIQFDGNYGDSFWTGSHRTGGDFPRMTTERNIVPGAVGTMWYPEPGWIANPYMVVNNTRRGDDTPGSIYLQAGNKYSLTMSGTVAIRSGRYEGATSQANERMYPTISLALGTNTTTYGWLELKDIQDNRTRLGSETNEIYLANKVGSSINVTDIAGAQQGDIWITSANNIGFNLGGDRQFNIYNMSGYTGGVPLHWESGRVTYLVSDAARKRLRDLVGVLTYRGPRDEPRYPVLDLQPETWLDTIDPDDHPRHAGFMAQQVAEVSAAHGGELDPLLARDDDGELISVHYHRITAYLIPVIKDLSRRISELEAPIATTARRAL